MISVFVGIAYYLSVVSCSVPVGAGLARPRSKTFEEYSKETDEIWDDKEEDFSDISVPSAELDFSKTEHEKVPLGVEGSPRVRNTKGKGKCEYLSYSVNVDSISHLAMKSDLLLCSCNIFPTLRPHHS